MAFFFSWVSFVGAAVDEGSSGAPAPLAGKFEVASREPFADVSAPEGFQLLKVSGVLHPYSAQDDSADVAIKLSFVVQSPQELYDRIQSGDASSPTPFDPDSIPDGVSIYLPLQDFVEGAFAAQDPNVTQALGDKSLGQAIGVAKSGGALKAIAGERDEVLSRALGPSANWDGATSFDLGSEADRRAYRALVLPPWGLADSDQVAEAQSPKNPDAQDRDRQEAQGPAASSAPKAGPRDPDRELAIGEDSPVAGPRLDAGQASPPAPDNPPAKDCGWDLGCRLRAAARGASDFMRRVHGVREALGDGLMVLGQEMGHPAELHETAARVIEHDPWCQGDVRRAVCGAIVGYGVEGADIIGQTAGFLVAGAGWLIRPDNPVLNGALSLLNPAQLVANAVQRRDDLANAAQDVARHPEHALKVFDTFSPHDQDSVSRNNAAAEAADAEAKAATGGAYERGNQVADVASFVLTGGVQATVGLARGALALAKAAPALLRNAPELAGGTARLFAAVPKRLGLLRGGAIAPSGQTAAGIGANAGRAESISTDAFRGKVLKYFARLKEADDRQLEELNFVGGVHKKDLVGLRERIGLQGTDGTCLRYAIACNLNLQGRDAINGEVVKDYAVDVMQSHVPDTIPFQFQQALLRSEAFEDFRGDPRHAVGVALKAIAAERKYRAQILNQLGLTTEQPAWGQLAKKLRYDAVPLADARLKGLILQAWNGTASPQEFLQESGKLRDAIERVLGKDKPVLAAVKNPESASHAVTVLAKALDKDGRAVAVIYDSRWGVITYPWSDFLPVDAYEIVPRGTTRAGEAAQGLARSAGSAARVPETLVRDNAAIAEGSARMAAAREQLGISEEQALAVLKAHDEVPCPVGGCGLAQLRQKVAILREGGLDEAQTRAALERGLAGELPTLDPVDKDFAVNRAFLRARLERLNAENDKALDEEKKRLAQIQKRPFRWRHRDEIEAIERVRRARWQVIWKAKADLDLAEGVHAERQVGNHSFPPTLEQKGKDPYKVLGVSPNAAPEEIRAAYLRKAERYGSGHLRGAKLAEQKLKEVTDAYRLLSITGSAQPRGAIEAAGGLLEAEKPARDPFRVLGVARNATPEELRAAYLRKADMYDPARLRGNKLAEQKLQELTQAYELLSIPGLAREGAAAETADEISDAALRAPAAPETFAGPRPETPRVARSAHSAARVPEKVVLGNAGIVSREARINAAMDQLGLTREQALAVVKAHEEVPCPVGGCTLAQLRRKAEILRAADLDETATRGALERGLAGTIAPEAEEEPGFSEFWKRSLPEGVLERDLASKVTFGPEWEFSNRKMATNDTAFWTEIYDTVKALKTEIWRRCMGPPIRCAVIGDTVIYPDNWWYKVSLDLGVVEVQAKPSTLAEFERHRDEVRFDLFGSAAKLGLFANAKECPSCGGHINIGIASAFGDDAKLFRNFLVDLANHPELFHGILEEDMLNAPALVDLKTGAVPAFRNVIERFDRGELGGGTIRDLAAAIQEDVYERFSAEGNPNKYEAVCLKSIFNRSAPEEARVEIRGVRAQENLDRFLWETRLFDRRLDYLRTLDAPLPVNPPSPAMSTKERLARFKKYVAEAGLPLEPYKRLPMRGRLR